MYAVTSTLYDPDTWPVHRTVASVVLPAPTTTSGRPYSLRTSANANASSADPQPLLLTSSAVSDQSASSVPSRASATRSTSTSVGGSRGRHSASLHHRSSAMLPSAVTTVTFAASTSATLSFSSLRSTSSVVGTVSRTNWLAICVTMLSCSTAHVTTIVYDSWSSSSSTPSASSSSASFQSLSITEALFTGSSAGTE